MVMAETEEKNTDFISQDDIDSLLSQDDEEDLEAETAVAEAMPEETEPAVESEASGEKKDSDFISQDDIDSLLSQAEEEDLEAENAAAEAMLAETEASDGESSKEPDQLLDGGGVEEDDEISDRVILEDVPDVPDEPDESDESDESDEPAAQKSRWGIKKLLLVASPVALIICGVLGFVFFSYLRKPADEGQQAVQSYSIARQESGKKTETVKILKEAVNLDEPAPVAAAHFIELKKFLVPAPMQRKDLTYVTADVSIELTTSSASRLIKDHSAFYRNIIYDVLKQALTVRDKSKINEISLKIAILKALNSALPERSIKDVIVSTFLMY